MPAIFLPVSKKSPRATRLIIASRRHRRTPEEGCLTPKFLLVSLLYNITKAFGNSTIPARPAFGLLSGLGARCQTTKLAKRGIPRINKPKMVTDMLQNQPPVITPGNKLSTLVKRLPYLSRKTQI